MVIAGETVGQIERGLVALIAAVPDDTATRAARLAERLLSYRVFPDDDGRMNRSLQETGYGLLAVPQFTLAADTRRGNRPGFSSACPPDRAEPLFDALLATLHARHEPVQSGRFGADMQVSLTNDGPVTFWLES